jgi:hypothetical protein
MPPHLGRFDAHSPLLSEPRGVMLDGLQVSVQAVSVAKRWVSPAPRGSSRALSSRGLWGAAVASPGPAICGNYGLPFVVGKLQYE